MLHQAKRLLSNSDASSATEYAIVIGLIVLAAVGVIGAMGVKIIDVVTWVADAL